MSDVERIRAEWIRDRERRVQVIIEDPVVGPSWAELRVDGEQFAAIGYRSPITNMEVYPRLDGRPWQLDVNDLVEALAVAVKAISTRLEQSDIDAMADDGATDERGDPLNLFGP